MTNSEKIRGLVFRLAGILNISDDWCKDNESTEAVLQACINRTQEIKIALRATPIKYFLGGKV